MCFLRAGRNPGRGRPDEGRQPSPCRRGCAGQRAPTPASPLHPGQRQPPPEPPGQHPAGVPARCSTGASGRGRGARGAPAPRPSRAGAEIRAEQFLPPGRKAGGRRWSEAPCHACVSSAPIQAGKDGLRSEETGDPPSWGSSVGGMLSEHHLRDGDRLVFHRTNAGASRALAAAEHLCLAAPQERRRGRQEPRQAGGCPACSWTGELGAAGGGNQRAVPDPELTDLPGLRA